MDKIGSLFKSKKIKRFLILNYSNNKGVRLIFYF